ncbi:transcriptional regulator, XRE family [Desulfofarcimen acetoxidans DSM 771]|jgi:cytoskeletal protein RodZ|uniref:Transcriptional regulator, XRE family n=1 Tax=Desulfofarcimen acetoxidans (strain ATCC 49208 / DSM 771 / KCTC 5769 / VKM B-1644 / 5575) TaxID=485916 RepID=C8W4H8_DESAS|nr:RodZ domain-containing protein [Desulfofarcimen acetoxidans]ACV63864.1 transcriptional regulator, XRE family [Desulfofarcimen acetoxidans DSM 771]
MEIGAVLKRVREEKGLTLEQAEERTKIRRKYIEALENEKFEVLPGPVYVKAFIKTYARYLDLNGDLLVEGLNKEMPDLASDPEVEQNKPAVRQLNQREKPVQRKTDRRKFKFNANNIFGGPGNYFKLAVGGLIIIGLLWGVTSIVSSLSLVEKPETGKQVQQVEDKDKETDQNADKNADNNSDQQSKLEELALKLNVTSDKSWIRVKVDGVVAFEGTLEEGQSKDFTAQDNMTVRLGNSGAVQIYVNGKNMGYVGEKGEPKDFTVDKQYSGIGKTAQNNPT